MGWDREGVRAIVREVVEDVLGDTTGNPVPEDLAARIRTDPELRAKVLSAVERRLDIYLLDGLWGKAEFTLEDIVGCYGPIWSRRGAGRG